MKLAHYLVAALVLAGLSSAPVFAQASKAAKPPAPHVNDDCLMCHGDASADRPVPAVTFVASVHGQASVACVDCHTDVATADLPHAATLAPVVCATCHPEPAAKYEGSVHAAARRAGTTVAASCKDCHGTHDVRRSSDPESRTNHLNLPQTCGHCHGNPEIIRRGGIKIGNVFRQFQDSIHGQALAKSGLVVAPNCSDCHGTHEIQKSASPESHIFRTNVPATCGKCHQGVQQRYEGGIHGTQMRSGNRFAPVCSTCHTAHQIRRVDTDSWKLQVMHECGTCHTESVKTYRDTFHGQVTALGFVRTAACVDCHGAHDILPKRDPRSTVSQARLVSTCSKCHPGATPQFVRYDPHADKHNPMRNPVLYYASRFMTSLLLFVFAFFGVHTTLWFARTVAMRRQGGGAAGKTGGTKPQGEPRGDA
jgi:hypothetical protein